MSKSFDEYLIKRDELYKIRQENNDIFTDNELPILDEMTKLWYDMTKEEQEIIKSQGSWKFKKS